MNDVGIKAGMLEENIIEQRRILKKVGESNFSRGLDIYLTSLLNWRIWFYMAITDIRRRYRRTLIVPFWVTLSVAIFIGSMGVIFPILWHTDVKSFLPFFSSGFIIWTFISSITTEACGTFIESVGLIKQTTLPYSVYANNVVTRNIIVMLHHLVVYVLIMCVFNVPVGLNTLLFIPGMVILCLTSSWVCLLLGLLASRFRDVRQIVGSLLQVSMFVTPIFWTPSQLGGGKKAQILVGANPLYHFIQIARAPLLDQSPSMIDWVVALSICILGWILTLKLLGKYKKHLIFWL